MNEQRPEVSPPAAAPRPILLATGNPDKQAALRRLLEGLPLAPVTPSELGLDADPAESGDTHQAIAESKAMEWSKAAGMLAVASDGGLDIPALGPRWQSRYTRRFAGASATNEQRADRLLELLRPCRGEQRRAVWIEALALADAGRLLESWEVRGASGVVAESRDPARPLPEFWVFALWRIPQFNAAYSDLTPAQLASVNDHWGRLRAAIINYQFSITN